MTDLAKELGVQSYTFRGFKDTDAFIKCVKDSGLSIIELCGVHINFQEDDKFDAVIKKYKDSGITIASIGVQGFSNNEAAERKNFEFARKAGIKAFSANFSLQDAPECFKTAEKLADEYDINLAIHNHGGRHWLGTAEMLRTVFAKTSKRIGLCLDTAWALDSREDPVKMAEEFGERLYGVHVKDFVFDRARVPEDVVVGTGNLKLKELIDTMKKVGFDGYAVLEYEGDVDNPVPAVKKCVAAVQAACK